MNYMVDIVAVLVLAAFAGRGAARGLILTVGKLVTLVGGIFRGPSGGLLFEGTGGGQGHTALDRGTPGAELPKRRQSGGRCHIGAGERRGWSWSGRWLRF